MRTKKGVVSSAKMTGTVTVTVHTHALHPKYKKRYRLTKKFLADPGEHTVALGDEVIIGECRPLSKRKCFRVVEIVKKADQLGEIKEDEAVEKAMHREKKRVTGDGSRVAEKAEDTSDTDPQSGTRNPIPEESETSSSEKE